MFLEQQGEDTVQYVAYSPDTRRRRLWHYARKVGKVELRDHAEQQNHECAHRRFRVVCASLSTERDAAFETRWVRATILRGPTVAWGHASSEIQPKQMSAV